MPDYPAVKVECYFCKGEGRVLEWIRDHQTHITCLNCDGCGYTLTDLGRDILTIVTDHLKIQLTKP